MCRVETGIIWVVNFKSIRTRQRNIRLDRLGRVSQKTYSNRDLCFIEGSNPGNSTC
jgi:hypothetical protein